MTKSDLSTADGVAMWLYGQVDDLYHARGSDHATIAYLAECVRLRVAFDGRCAKHDAHGPFYGHYECSECDAQYVLEPLRDAMKGEDK